MNEGLLNILVITGTLIIIGAIFFVTNRRKKADEQALQKLSSENDWQVFFIRESLRSGLVITGENWRFESTATSSGRESGPGSSDIALRTTWSANLPGSPVYISSKPANASLSGASVRAAQALLQFMSDSTMQNLRESQAGSSRLHQRYRVWAQDDGAVAQLLTPEVETGLLEWAGAPLLIRQDTDGLVVEINGFQIKKPGEILSVIQLGQALSAGRLPENAIIE